MAQIPTKQVKLAKKASKEIQAAIDEGNMRLAVALVLHEINSPGFDLVTICAAAKATELIALGKERIAELASHSIVQKTPIAYIYDESVKHARGVTGVEITDDDERVLEKSLKTMIAKSLADAVPGRDPIL